MYCFTAAVFITSCSSGDKRSISGGNMSMGTLIEQATAIQDSGNMSGAIHYIDSSYKARKDITIKERFDYYDYLYEVYNRSGDTVKPILYIDSMLYLIHQTKSERSLFKEYALAVYAKADLLLHQGNYDKAYQYYYKAKEISEENNDSSVLRYYVYKLGLVLYMGERYAPAIPYFLQAFDMYGYFEKNTFQGFYRQQEILDNIGLCYSHLGKPDSALYYYNKTLDFINKNRKENTENRIRLYDMAVAVVYGNMGSAYEAIGDDKKAEDVLKRSITINLQKGYDNRDAQYTRIKLASLYLKQKKFTESKLLLDLVKKTIDSSYSVPVALRWNNVMWQYWQSQNRLGSAFTHLLAYKKLADSIEASNYKVVAVNMDVKVNDIEQQNTIDVLREKDDLKNKYLFIGAVVSFLGILVLFLVYKNWEGSRRNVKILQELNNRIKEQKAVLQNTLQELNNAGHEKDRILKAVSHDMRSPVNSALALIELVLNDKEKLSKEQLGYIALIKDSCANALSLTKDLLEVTTLNPEQMEKAPVDVKSLIKTAVELSRFKAAEKQQVIELSLPDDPVVISLNKEKISRVINNLVNNAIKFSRQAGVIDVKLGIETGGITFSVKDNGIGIPKNMKDIVFDIFTEAKRFGTSGEQPYGLGLSISKQIVEAHRGEIWFDSEVDKGSEFYVFIPNA